MWKMVRSFLKVFYLIFSLGLFLIACSDSNKPPEQTKPALQHVSLQLQWVTQAQFAGYYVALDKGWYRDEGIEIDIKPGGPDIIPIDLVASGTRDFGTAFLADLTVAIEKGQQLISIGQIQHANGLLLIAKKSSGIKEPKDFIGKKVGVWFQGFEAQFNALLAKEKISTQNIKIIPQGWSMEPFLNDELDVASAMIYNEYHVVLESGINADDINVIDYRSYGLDLPGDTLFTSRKLVTENPDLCIRVLRASLKGWQYAVQHPEEAIDIVLKHDTSRIQKRDHQKVMMQEITNLVQSPGKTMGYIDPAVVSRMLEILYKNGIIKKALRPEDVFQGDLFQKVQTSK